MQPALRGPARSPHHVLPAGQPAAVAARRGPSADAMEAGEIDALLRRAAAARTQEGPEAAAEMLLGPFPAEAPPERLFRAAVRHFIEAGEPAGAVPLFDRLARPSPLRARLAPLLLETLIRAGALDRAAAVLENATGRARPDPQVEQWRIALLCARGDIEGAVAELHAHLTRFGEDAQPLLGVLRILQPREPFLDVLALRCGDTLTDPKVMVAFTWGYWTAGRPSDALHWAERALSAGATAASLNLIAARAAQASGEAEKARRLLSVFLMTCVPQEHAGNGLAALQEVLLCEDNLQEFQAALLSQGEFPFSRQMRSALDLARGDMQTIIDRYLEDSRAPDFVFDAGEFICFCGACIETSRYELMRSEILRIPPGAELERNHLMRMLRMPTVEETAETRALVVSRLHALPQADEDTAETLILGLSLAESGSELERFAARAAAHLDRGHPAAELRLFLAEHGAAVAGRLADGAVAERLRLHATTAMEVLTDPYCVSFVESERHLCEIMHQRMVAAEQSTPRVSILAPVHRADDLPNLRDSIARQSWPALEAVVVANGPLRGDPAVERCFEDLPGVRVLHHDGRHVGAFLNAAADAATGDYLVRFDADDIYFDHYVTTAIRTMQSADADMAGKSAVFFYSQAFDRIFLARHARYFGEARKLGCYGTGSTQCFRREVFEQIRFLEHIDRGEDYLFYTAAIQTGWRVFNLDPFNHLIIRRADRSAHTWHAGDRALFPGALHCIGGPQNLGRLATMGPPTPPIRLLHIGMPGIPSASGR
ncbi:glycosyltransferase [Oceanicella sp. SM1341]|uniref:glycosyltransferase n=1 Tax=Oceanicella sp. SM1341 TaxID=1548889 RepID=UPI000E499610|nr:glycosyltransferase [Oceanicella sp. SM1341]